MTDKGEFTYDGGNMALSPRLPEGSVSLKNFVGNVLLSNIYLWTQTTVKVLGENFDLKLLISGLITPPEGAVNMRFAPPTAKIGYFAIRDRTQPDGLAHGTQSTLSDDFLREVYRPLREQAPRAMPAPRPGVTNVAFYHTYTEGLNGLVIQRGDGYTVPSAPSDLHGAGISSSQIRLQWRDDTGNETGYAIERKAPDGAWQKVGLSGADTGYFVDNRLITQTTYSYQVSAYNGAGQSAPSPEIQLTTLEPQGIKISCGGGAIGDFVADSYYTGGRGVNYDYNSPIDLTAVQGMDPAPETVYQKCRNQDPSYKIPGMKPNAPCLVRLHLCENYLTRAGIDSITIKINGKVVESKYDLFVACGGHNKARINEYTTTADDYGFVTVEVLGNGSKLAGLEVLPIKNE
jgi:hypothetical protein